MSRAFVKETEAEEVAGRTWGAALPPGTPNLATPRGGAQLEQLLADLVAERAALPEDGIGAGRRATLDAEIRALEAYLPTVRVTEPPANPERVAFGVTAEVEMDGEERQITIVGVDEADPAHGRVSFLSPLARGLQGAVPGDVVTVRMPKGDVEISWATILDIYDASDPETWLNTDGTGHGYPSHNMEDGAFLTGGAALFNDYAFQAVTNGTSR